MRVAATSIRHMRSPIWPISDQATLFPVRQSGPGGSVWKVDMENKKAEPLNADDAVSKLPDPKAFWISRADPSQSRIDKTRFSMPPPSMSLARSITC